MILLILILKLIRLSNMQALKRYKNNNRIIRFYNGSSNNEKLIKKLKNQKAKNCLS